MGDKWWVRKYPLNQIRIQENFRMVFIIIGHNNDIYNPMVQVRYLHIEDGNRWLPVNSSLIFMSSPVEATD